MDLNLAIVVFYLVTMLAFGFWGRSRTRTSSDYLVAGRRLGGFFYTGTMAAVVLGGASTVGGVGLGYQMGLSGMWLVVAIGAGVLLLSLLFAGRLQRLRIHTVSEMLELRYGHRATDASSIVMLAYTIFLSVTSTGAYATVLHVLLGWERWACILLGGVVVLVYSVVGGMWSITLADQVQFFIKTIGIFFLMLPLMLVAAGGWSGLAERLDAGYFDLVGNADHGADTQTIITWFVIYMFGILIGQDIWQRVFTARTPGVAKWGGTVAGVYVIAYGAAGAIIGMAARATMGDAISARDDVYAEVANTVLPVGVGGFVLAAAVAAMMSTASGALIAAATVARNDVVPMLTGSGRATSDDESDPHSEQHVRENRSWVLGLGALIIAISAWMSSLEGGSSIVVAWLTVAYDILVGGLLVAILGGLVWRRGNGLGAGASMIVGTVVTLATMAFQARQLGSVLDGILSNEPIYYGLLSSLVVYVAVSLLTKPVEVEVRQEWERRVAGARPDLPGLRKHFQHDLPEQPDQADQADQAVSDEARRRS